MGTAGAVVRARRSGSEVGDEVHDYLRSEAPCELRQASVVEDIADDGLGAERAKGRDPVGRACHPGDDVALGDEQRQQANADHSGRPGEEHPHRC